MDDFDFWDARPELAHICDFARAQRVGPWAVLGECLALAVCHVSPAFQLPDYVGSYGSLNMLIAVTGDSGAGKGATRAVARRVFHWDDIPEVPLGSGEGMVKSFGFMTKDGGLERTDYRVILTAAEIDTLKAQFERGGATLSPELRKLYSGETIGFGYSDRVKRVIIEGHTYRACVIAGVQPGRGGVILDDVDSGFAQRWLWLPVADPYAPPFAPPRRKAKANPLCREVLGIDDDAAPVIMEGCERAENFIDNARFLRLRGEGSSIESHALFTRLKVAAALALLSGNDCIKDEDWELAGMVMQKSGETRDAVARALRANENMESARRGHDQGIRNEQAEETRDSQRSARIGDRVVQIIKLAGAEGEWLPRSTIANLINSKDRKLLPVIIEGLKINGEVEEREDECNGKPRVMYRIPKST